MEMPPKRDETFIGRPASGRSTDELIKIIEGSSGFKDTMEEIGPDLVEKSFSQRLGELMERRGVKASELAELSLMSRSYVYQLCSGEREPGRDVVLRLALFLRAGIPETQRLLRAAGRGMLYPRVRRDAILLYALREELEIYAVDELLSGSGEEPLIKVL